MEHSRPRPFDRFTYLSIIPGLALPSVAQIARDYGSRAYDSGLISGVFLYVLLGSMTLNAYLMLRRTGPSAVGSLDRHRGIALTALHLTVAAGAVVFGFFGRTLALQQNRFATVSLIFAGAVIVQSIWVFSAAVLRRNRMEAEWIAPAPLAAPGAFIIFGGIAVGVAAAVLTIGAGVADITDSWATSPILVYLGLPWSYFVHPITLLVSRDVMVFRVLLTLPVVVNIVLATLALTMPRARVQLARRLFQKTA